MAQVVDLFGGPLDGERRLWPDPLPPQIAFPVLRGPVRAWFEKQDPLEFVPMRVLVYRHRGLGAYDFLEERDH